MARVPQRSRLLTIMVLTFVLVLSGSALAQEQKHGPAADREPSPELRAKLDRIIVKFEPSTSPTGRANARGQAGVEKVRNLGFIRAEVVVARGRSAAEAARALDRRPDVEYAVVNRLVHRAGYSDEPRFGELWGLHNTGQAIDDDPVDQTPGSVGTPDVDVDGMEASAVSQGDPNLVVAVIDDGVDFSHPDLKDNAWVNTGETGPDALGGDKATNGTDDDQNGCIDDVNGCNFPYRDGSVGGPVEGRHGTHVSGTIAASANGVGVVGVAPKVKIMAVKFLDPEGYSTIEDAIDAIAYATSNGAKISNNSWAYVGAPDPALQNAIQVSEMLFVAASSNGGNDFLGDDNDADPNNTAYPASFDSPNVLSVAAANNQGKLSLFSNFGAATVDVAAPGERILSATSGGGWGYLSGTSMAAPHAVGVAALAASENPGLLQDPAALKRTVMNGAKPLPATAGKTVTGGMVSAKPDVAAPTVESVVPSANAREVRVDTKVEAAFSEAMRASTLNVDTFTLVKQGTDTPVATSVAYDTAGKRAVLTAQTNLEPGATYEARLRGGADGAKDFAGNALAADKVWAFTVAAPVAAAPDTAIDSGPSGPINRNSASFTFSSTEAGSSFRCSLDGAAFEPCASPKDYVNLPDGPHAFRVEATGAAGNNTDPTPADRTWTVDTVFPTVQGVAPEEGAEGVPLANARVEATFSEAMKAGAINGSTFALVRQGETTPVTATVTYDENTRKATLTPGADLSNSTTYVATVKGGTNGAKDQAGNPLATSATWSFATIAPQDTTPPETTINSGPSGPTNSTSASFGLGSNEAGSAFECSLDGGAYASCSSPKGYSSLAQGSHTFSVRAKDATGNVDASPANRYWTVDTVAPGLTTVAPPVGSGAVAAGTDVTATFSEAMNASTLNTATFKLVRSGTTTAVSATVTYDAATKKSILNPGAALAPGASYTATIKGGSTGAKDEAGNPLGADKIWSFTVNSAPTIYVPGYLNGATSRCEWDRTPTITATVADAQTDLAKTNIRFYLDSVEKTTFTYDQATDRLSFTQGSNLAYGQHSFTITARDPQGLVTTVTRYIDIKTSDVRCT